MDGEKEKPRVIIDEQSFYLKIWTIDETTKQLLEIWYQSIKSKEITKKEPEAPEELMPIDVHKELLDGYIEKQKIKISEMRRKLYDSTQRDESGNKHCSKCGEWRPEAMFYKKPGTKDGLGSQCKKCISFKQKPDTNTEKKLQEAVLQSLLSDKPAGGRPKENPAESSKKAREKPCNKCGEIKPFSDFCKRTADPTGRQATCRECQKKISNEWRQKHMSVKSKKQPENNIGKPLTETDKEPSEKTLVSVQAPSETKPIKTLSFTPERDQKLRDAFIKKDLGVSGIYDADILPGFSLTEIRRRCQELGLLDQYGLRPTYKKTVDGDPKQ